MTGELACRCVKEMFMSGPLLSPFTFPLLIFLLSGFACRDNRGCGGYLFGDCCSRFFRDLAQREAATHQQRHSERRPEDNARLAYDGERHAAGLAQSENLCHPAGARLVNTHTQGYE